MYGANASDIVADNMAAAAAATELPAAKSRKTRASPDASCMDTMESYTSSSDIPSGATQPIRRWTPLPGARGADAPTPTASTIARDAGNAQHDPGLEYGANAPDIAADNMATHAAAAGHTARPHAGPSHLGPRGVVMPSLQTTAPERTVELVNRSDDEATSRAPDWDRGMLRQMHTMSIMSLDKMQAPPRKAGHVVSTKVIFTSCPDPDNTCDAAEAFVIPPNATHATANIVVTRLRGFILQHIRDCAANSAPHRWGGANANATFQSIFPMGKDAFSPMKDGGLPTGQIAMLVAVEEVTNLTKYLQFAVENCCVVATSGPTALVPTHAIAVEKTYEGRPIHQGEVQMAIKNQTGQDSAVFYNNKDFKNSVIYAFHLLPDQFDRICEKLGGEAGVEILDSVSPIFDFAPKALRHRIYLVGPGGEGPMQEAHVRQWLADVLCTDPNTMLIEQVRDVTTKHGGLYCVELDYTQDSYDQCCELIMQVVATVKNPRKPRYAGLKLTFAQSPDEMQLLLNYGILKSISTPEASPEIGAGPLLISPTKPRLVGRYITGPPAAAAGGSFPPAPSSAPAAAPSAPRAPPHATRAMPPSILLPPAPPLPRGMTEQQMLQLQQMQQQFEQQNQQQQQLDQQRLDQQRLDQQRLDQQQQLAPERLVQQQQLAQRQHVQRQQLLDRQLDEEQQQLQQLHAPQPTQQLQQQHDQQQHLTWQHLSQQHAAQRQRQAEHHQAERYHSLQLQRPQLPPPPPPERPPQQAPQPLAQQRQLDQQQPDRQQLTHSELDRQQLARQQLEQLQHLADRQLAEQQQRLQQQQQQQQQFDLLQQQQPDSQQQQQLFDQQTAVSWQQLAQHHLEERQKLDEIHLAEQQPFLQQQWQQQPPPLSQQDQQQQQQPMPLPSSPFDVPPRPQSGLSPDAGDEVHMIPGSADSGARRPRLRFPPGLAADPRLATCPPHPARTSHLSPPQPISEPREGTPQIAEADRGGRRDEISLELQAPHSEGSSPARETPARGQREEYGRERGSRGEDGDIRRLRATEEAVGGRVTLTLGGGTEETMGVRMDAWRQQQQQAAQHIASTDDGSACATGEGDRSSPNLDDAPRDNGLGRQYVEVWGAYTCERVWDGSRRMVTYLGKMFASSASRIRRKRVSHASAAAAIAAACAIAPACVIAPADLAVAHALAAAALAPAALAPASLAPATAAAAAALAAAVLAAAATNVPSAADCLPRLTYLDLTQTRSWDGEGGVTGRVPEWLLDRLDFVAPLRLANNALDDPTAAETAVAISRLWQRCQTLGAGQCSGVPPIGCSAFNRQGRRRGERAQIHSRHRRGA